MPYKDFTRNSVVSRTSTITRTTGSSASFTRVTRVGNSTGFYAGNPSSRVSTYSEVVLDGQGEAEVLYYSRTFVGDFVGNFTNDRQDFFSRTRTETYTGYYSRAFAGNYSRSYEGTYSRGFTGTYSRSFTRSYARNFARHFARAYTGYYTTNSQQSFSRTSVESYSNNFTRTSTYTRTLSGGSGETPTYTVTGSDADYGLVVYGPDGTTEIINPTTRVINLAFYGSIPVPANSSVTRTIEDVGDPTKVIVSLLFHYNGVITLSTSGNTLTITNTTGYAYNVYVSAIRI